MSEDTKEGEASLATVIREHLALLDHGPDMRGPVFFRQLWASRERLRKAFARTQADARAAQAAIDKLKILTGVKP